jgi:hypothetical protein
LYRLPRKAFIDHSEGFLSIVLGDSHDPSSATPTIVLKEKSADFEALVREIYPQ